MGDNMIPTSADKKRYRRYKKQARRKRIKPDSLNDFMEKCYNVEKLVPKTVSKKSNTTKSKQTKKSTKKKE